MKFDHLVKNGILVSRGESFKADIGITDGKIYEIAEGIGTDEGENLYDADGCYVTPGFIDSHVHLTGGGGESGFRTRVPEISLSVFSPASRIGSRPPEPSPT